MTRKLEESIVIKGIREEERRLMNPTVDSLKRLIVAVFFLSILPLPAHAFTPSQIFDKVKDSVFEVKTLDG